MTLFVDKTNLKDDSSSCNLKRTPTLRRQIIAPPPLPPLYPASSPIMTRRNPKIPPTMPASFFPSVSPSIIPSRQTSYHEKPSLNSNRKEKSNKNKSPNHRHRNKSNKHSQSHHHNSLMFPVQSSIYGSRPMIIFPKSNNYSNRFYEKDDEPYEVKPMIYSGFNQVFLIFYISKPQ